MVTTHEPDAWLAPAHGPWWWDRAECLGLGLLMFPPPGKGSPGPAIAAATAICADCPVAEECLEDGLAVPPSIDIAGVLAGLTPRDRMRLRRRRQAKGQASP